MRTLTAYLLCLMSCTKAIRRQVAVESKVLRTACTQIMFQRGRRKERLQRQKRRVSSNISGDNQLGDGRKRGSSTSTADGTLLVLLASIVVMFFVCNIPAAINLVNINERAKQTFRYQVRGGSEGGRGGGGMEGWTEGGGRD